MLNIPKTFIIILLAVEVVLIPAARAFGCQARVRGRRRRRLEQDLLCRRIVAPQVSVEEVLGSKASFDRLPPGVGHDVRRRFVEFGEFGKEPASEEDVAGQCDCAIVPVRVVGGGYDPIGLREESHHGVKT